MLLGAKTMKFLSICLEKTRSKYVIRFVKVKMGNFNDDSGTRVIGIPLKVDIDNALISHIVQHTLHTYYFYNFYYKTLISYPPYH